MKKIPLEYKEQATESCSIIESNLEEKNDLGGRAKKDSRECEVRLESNAMTPPVSFVNEALAAGGRQSTTAREVIEGICNEALENKKIDDDFDTFSQDHSVRPLFGQIEPAYTLQKEQAHHRPLLYLAAAGDTPAEIAEKLGWSRPMVGYILKQPWAQKAIVELQDKAGKKSVMNVLQGATLMAAERLIKIAEGQVPGAKISDSVNCAKEILSRVYGSAPQVVLTGKVDPNELSDEELASKLQGN